MSTTIFEILRRLDEAKIHYFIERNRCDTIDVTATFVGTRLEISVFEDGHFEVSKFQGNEDILDESVLYELIGKEISDDKRLEEQFLQSQNARGKSSDPD